MRESPILWIRPDVAGLPGRRAVGLVGEVEVGSVEFDPGNRLWLWSSPLAEEAWGWGSSEDGAKRALELWLRAWLAPFKPFFDPPDRPRIAPVGDDAQPAAPRRSQRKAP